MSDGEPAARPNNEGGAIVPATGHGSAGPAVFEDWQFFGDCVAIDSSRLNPTCLRSLLNRLKDPFGPKPDFFDLRCNDGGMDFFFGHSSISNIQLLLEVIQCTKQKGFLFHMVHTKWSEHLHDLAKILSPHLIHFVLCTDSDDVANDAMLASCHFLTLCLNQPNCTTTKISIIDDEDITDWLDETLAKSLASIFETAAAEQIQEIALLRAPVLGHTNSAPIMNAIYTHCKNLKRFVYSFGECHEEWTHPEEVMHSLLSLVDHHKELEEINVDDVRLSEADPQELFQKLETLPNLKRVSFDMFTRHPSKVLNLLKHQTHGWDKIAFAFHGIFRCELRLTRDATGAFSLLFPSRFLMTEQLYQEIVDFAASIPNLQSLNCPYHRDPRSLGRLFRSPSCQISHLTVIVEDEDERAHWQEVLQNYDKLECLELHATVSDFSGPKNLCPASQLKQLHFGFGESGEMGSFQGLASAIQEQQSLTCLSIVCERKIDDEELEEIAHALRDHPSLNQLEVDPSVEYADETNCALFPYLKHNITLKRYVSKTFHDRIAGVLARNIVKSVTPDLWAKVLSNVSWSSPQNQNHELCSVLCFLRESSVTISNLNTSNRGPHPKRKREN